MSKKTKVLKLCIIILCIFEFVFGVIEAKYLIDYVQFDNGCYKVWRWLTIGSGINILSSLLCLGFLASFKIKNKYNYCTLFKIQSSQIVTSTWSIIVYFDMDDSCRNFWITMCPELYKFI